MAPVGPRCFSSCFVTWLWFLSIGPGGAHQLSLWSLFLFCGLAMVFIGWVGICFCFSLNSLSDRVLYIASYGRVCAFLAPEFVTRAPEFVTRAPDFVTQDLASWGPTVVSRCLPLLFFLFYDLAMVFVDRPRGGPPTVPTVPLVSVGPRGLPLAPVASRWPWWPPVAAQGFAQKIPKRKA